VSNVDKDDQGDREILRRAIEMLNGDDERLFFPRDVLAQKTCRRLLQAWANELESGVIREGTRHAALELASKILYPGRRNGTDTRGVGGADVGP
jgi:hypothetical protein